MLTPMPHEEESGTCQNEDDRGHADAHAGFGAAKKTDLDRQTETRIGAI